MFVVSACKPNENNNLLSEIYLSGNPQGFEKINVDSIVAKYIKPESSKETVLELLKQNDIKVIQENNNELTARYNWGNIMTRPDPKSVVIYFTFQIRIN